MPETTPPSEINVHLIPFEERPERDTVVKNAQAALLVYAGIEREFNNHLLEENQQQAARIQELETENEEKDDRILYLRNDMLVANALTRKGFSDHLRNNRDIQLELEGMEWGVVVLDGLGVKIFNDIASRKGGDKYIERGGANVIDLVGDLCVGRYGSDRRSSASTDYRGEERRSGEERRRSLHEHNDDTLDILGDMIIRGGEASDELVVIVRGISPDDLQRIVYDRLRVELSVGTALDRYRQGEVPFISSVGFAHVQDLEESELRSHFESDDHYSAVMAVASRAENMEAQAKQVQYDQMWTMLKRQEAEGLPANKPDNRIIASLFYQRFCNKLYENPWPYLAQHPSRLPKQ